VFFMPRLQIALGADIDSEFEELLSKLYSCTPKSSLVPPRAKRLSAYVYTWSDIMCSRDDAYRGPPAPAAFKPSGSGADLWQLLRVMRPVALAGGGEGAQGEEGWELGPRDLNQGKCAFQSSPHATLLKSLARRRHYPPCNIAPGTQCEPQRRPSAAPASPSPTWQPCPSEATARGSVRRVT
jgi:hypothetical protein